MAAHVNQMKKVPDKTNDPAAKLIRWIFSLCVLAITITIGGFLGAYLGIVVGEVVGNTGEAIWGNVMLGSIVGILAGFFSGIGVIDAHKKKSL
jgi:hypothetical protein